MLLSGAKQNWTSLKHSTPPIPALYCLRCCIDFFCLAILYNRVHSWVKISRWVDSFVSYLHNCVGLWLCSHAAFRFECAVFQKWLIIYSRETSFLVSCEHKTRCKQLVDHPIFNPIPGPIIFFMYSSDSLASFISFCSASKLRPASTRPSTVCCGRETRGNHQVSENDVVSVGNVSIHQHG